MILIENQPFTLYQNIIVFNDNKEIITRTKASMKNIPEVVSQLAEEHKIYDIKILGNKKYNEKTKDKINECYFAKYNARKLKIQLI